MTSVNSQNDERPIGVFDSGIGGLTVLKELLYHFPHESFVYLGDTARLPYGTKSPETIRRYSLQNLDFLLQQNVKALIIACNSASTQMLENSYKGIPLYNVIDPGSKEALRKSSSKKIGILGTRATILSKTYELRIKSLDANAEVFSAACPLFVPLAEEGWIDDPITNMIAFRYLQGLLKHRIDTLVLGCTHYPIIKNAIARVTGNDIVLIDSGEAVAVRLQTDLGQGQWRPATANKPLILKVTDASDHFLNLARRILAPFAIEQYEVVNL